MASKLAKAAFQKVNHYVALAEQHCNEHLKKITLDNGSEFINHLLVPYCEHASIYLQTTASHTPAENGVAERSNLTIVSKARTMMVHANLPIRFWLYTIKEAVYLSNQTVTSLLPTGMTPSDMWHKRKPDVAHIRTFGCQCSALIQKELRHGKFSQVAMSGVLVGHTDHNHNYIKFLPETNTVVTTHHASFQETTFPFRRLRQFDISYLTMTDDHPLALTFDDNAEHHQPDPACETEPTPEAPQTPPSDDNQDLLPIAVDPPILPESDPAEPAFKVQRSERESRPVDYYRTSSSPAFWHNNQSVIPPCSPHAYAFATSPTVRLLHKPPNFCAAMSSPAKAEWKAACQKEMVIMRDKAVWSLVPRPRTIQQLAEDGISRSRHVWMVQLASIRPGTWPRAILKHTEWITQKTLPPLGSQALTARLLPWRPFTVTKSTKWTPWPPS